MIELLAGTLLAVAALSFVLYPLLFGARPKPVPDVPADVPPRNEAVDALREIEFDRATGKLSDTDYDALKASYTQRAITAMRGSVAAPVCDNCGERPEATALFCSRCGRALATGVR